MGFVLFLNDLNEEIITKTLLSPYEVPFIEMEKQFLLLPPLDDTDVRFHLFCFIH